MKTILKNQSIKPRLDDKGNWLLPRGNIRFPGELAPKISPGAWQLLLILKTENLSKEALSQMCDSLVGSRTTVWRKRKELKDKGYL